MSSIQISGANPFKQRGEVLIVGVVATLAGPQIAAGFDPQLPIRKLKSLLSALELTGTANEVVCVPSDLAASTKICFIGLGAHQELLKPHAQISAELVETLRRACGVAVRALGKSAQVVVALPAQQPNMVAAIVEGLLCGEYEYLNSADRVFTIFSINSRRPQIAAAASQATEIANQVNLARNWVNCPPNQLYPTEFAAQIAANAPQNLECKIYQVSELKKMKAGGILAVGSGSANPPCLVKLSYHPAGATKHIALVGKGITFDSGGLSIKPATSMASMKFDMAGAAAVAAATIAIAKLGLPIKITSYLPLAENLISAASYRPGDVVNMLSGETVEVHNTDAEGRMILADALTLASRAKPDLIVDLATLTGACMVSLGEKVAGVFGDETVSLAIRDAAHLSGELFWQLPLPTETKDRIKSGSEIADLLQHSPVRWGGSSWAAAFLAAFVVDTPWAHLDIAGPAWNANDAWGLNPKGGTGFGVRTLVQLASSY